MRTPNTTCVLCEMPLYRRPHEMAASRFSSCRKCHGPAMTKHGMTEAQAGGLALGRRKGVNNRTGSTHSAETKLKISRSNVAYHRANPDIAKAKGENLRSAKHYAWRGGVSQLNIDIRLMDENRKWLARVKTRDGRCVRCGSLERLEVHHKTPLRELLTRMEIRNRDDARIHAAALWDDANGETLCEACHYAEHGRRRRAG